MPRQIRLAIAEIGKKSQAPAKSFVTDMGDPLHEAVTDEFLKQVFDVMAQVPQHRFYFLTKRADRLGEIGPQLPWKPWIWAGVTVESDKYVHRIDQLKKLPGNVNKFLIFEPLLSPMPQLDLEGIGWVVVGGETNKKMKYRPIKEEWVIDIRDQVKSAGASIHVQTLAKQNHKSKPALLEGEIWAEYPESLLVNVNW